MDEERKKKKKNKKKREESSQRVDDPEAEVFEWLEFEEDGSKKKVPKPVEEEPAEEEEESQHKKKKKKKDKKKNKKKDKNSQNTQETQSDEDQRLKPTNEPTQDEEQLQPLPEESEEEAEYEPESPKERKPKMKKVFQVSQQEPPRFPETQTQTQNDKDRDEEDITSPRSISSSLHSPGSGKGYSEDGHFEGRRSPPAKIEEIATLQSPTSSIEVKIESSLPQKEIMTLDSDAVIPTQRKKSGKQDVVVKEEYIKVEEEMRQIE